MFKRCHIVEFLSGVHYHWLKYIIIFTRACYIDSRGGIYFVLFSFFQVKRPSLNHILSIYDVLIRFICLYQLWVMAQLNAILLFHITFWPLLCIGLQSQYKSKIKCVFQGDEDTNNFYQAGDVVLGGIFPLHSSPISSFSSFMTKPEPTKYTLCVMLS